MDGIQFPAAIHLYGGTDPERLDPGEISDYLSFRLAKIRVQLRKDIIQEFFEAFPPAEKERKMQQLAKRLAQTRVYNIQEPRCSRKPLQGEIEFERKWLLKQARKPSGLLYDGFELQRIYFDLLPIQERNLQYLHIVLTNQLFATWDTANGRYHARVSVYGFPCVLSSAGLVEAPARPRDFYLQRQMGVNPLELKKEYAGRFLDHDGSQLTEAMKGYVMQTFFYHALGNPFCRDKQCRLFNAHWQEELIKAQLTSDYEFCQYHRRILGLVR